MEKLGDSLRKLEQWKGKVPTQLYDKKKAQLLKESGLTDPKFATASERGSQEARTTMLNYQFGGSQDKKELEKQALIESKNHTKLLKQLVEGRTNPAPAF